MLVLENPRHGQPQLFEEWLPSHMLELEGELAVIDKLLNEEKIIEVIKKRGKISNFGRPTIPIVTFFRMMVLKRLYDLSYAALVKNVSDSFKWRKFCHLSLVEKVPDRSTLIKLVRKYGGEEIINEINEEIIKGAREKRIIKGKRLRVDTMVVESAIHYPTDSSLIGDSVRVITRLVKKIKEAGGAIKTRFRDRLRSVKKRILGISKLCKSRVGEAKENIEDKTRELLGILEETVKEARVVMRNSLKKSYESAFVRRLRERLKEVVNISDGIIKQTVSVLSGENQIEMRKVSIFDDGACVIKKGKFGKEVEFGRKVSIAEVEHGIITRYKVYEGNPNDRTLLGDEIAQHKRLFGYVPDEVATDRGYYSKSNERLLIAEGVKRISMPKIGKKTRERELYEKSSWFRRLQRFRAGSEAKISLLKRKFGLRRSLVRGNENVSAWVGWGILACNLWQIARLIEQKQVLKTKT